jgi:hypothetical protein
VISAAADLARRLARDAEAVCHHCLSNSRRSGRYWIAGDAMNTPGRSLYVRLQGPDYGPVPPANGPMPQPARRALGHLLGNGVRFGDASDISPPAKASKRCWRSNRCCRSSR